MRLSDCECVPEMERLGSQLLTDISCYNNSTEINSGN